MRPNIVSGAGLQTRFGQWWGGITFVTSGVLILCSAVYLVCLLFGYDSFHQVCFLPSEVISHFQELERIMGSVRLVYLIWLLATSNGLLHLIIALTVAKNPFYDFSYLGSECAIGFSGVLFSMIVIETSLSGIHSRSFFGFFNVPTKWYPWILLLLIQLIVPKASLLGHLCGIISGIAYTYGLFQYVTPGPSFYSAIEGSSILSSCLRRPGFILASGGASYGSLPTYSNASASPSLLPGNIWRNISSWVPQMQTSPPQASGDPRFPGRGRALGSVSAPSPAASHTDPDSSLQARLLDNSPTDSTSLNPVQRLHDARPFAADTGQAATQDSDGYEEEVKKLMSLGFEKTQVEVALAAADGDTIIAGEILMSQPSS